MTRTLDASVVVVTGAGSGIGRSTALAFAKRGAAVVLAGRREAPLRELARGIEREGGRALAWPTDVTDERAVVGLARRAVDSYGRLDVWVNSAAVAAFGSFEETPMDVFRQVLETNVIGTANGARAALPIFRAQGEGVFIAVGSILGKASVPYLAAYNASKFAVTGLMETLRQEWAEDGVCISTVMPPPTDTPFYEHAANYTGRVPRPPPPVYEAETVAEAIVACAEDPEREVVVGSTAKFQQLIHAVAPSLYERVTAASMERGLFLEPEGPPVPPTDGNVFQPMVEGAGVTGGWKRDTDEARERVEGRPTRS